MASKDRLPITVGLRRKRPPPFAAPSSSAASVSSHGSSSSKRTAPGEIPYVSADAGRTRYYADRFYLDAPTSLLEYQVDKNKKLASLSYNPTRRDNLYCNKCGEKKAQPPPRIRYDHNRNRLPPEKPPDDNNRPPLFDRAEFINSLDLAAAIVGTYTIGDLEYLKEAFPKLFPSSKNVDGSSVRSHVPTLVLHGQKGFYLEKKEKATVMHAVKTSIKIEKEEEAMHLRGGGSSQSSLQSKSPIVPTPVECRQDNGDNNEDKLNFLTYEGAKVRLPNTPKRKRKGRKRVKREKEEVVAQSSDIAKEESIQKVEKVLSKTKCDGSVGINSDNQASISHSSLCEKYEEMKPPPKKEFVPKANIPVTSAAPAPSLLHAPPAERVTKTPIDPLYSDYYDSSQDNMMSQEELANRARWAKIQPTPLFGGEVFFTRVFPGWIRPPEKFKGESSAVMNDMVPEETVSAAFTENDGNMGYSDDEEHAYETAYDELIDEKRSKNPDLKTELGVHHPKFFLLFEKSGSIVVIISTSNLTPQTAVDGSWVQRFDARHESQYDQFNQSDVDLGMPSDFGTILTDFLMKQSDATANGSMLPDIFLRRYVKGLSLSGLRTRYKFEDAQVHLVSTVPGHHKGSIPPKGLDATLSPYKPQITYGPQRVSFILSRLLDAYHMQLANNNSKRSRRLVGPMWIPKPLWPAMNQLIVQPTSLGGNWTRESLEEVVAKYLQKDPEDMDDELLEEVDIIWPSWDFFALMKEKRHAVWELNQHTKAASIIRRRMNAEKKKPKRERLHVFLSSDSFAGLDRSVISRMALYETSHPLQIPFTSSSLHIKSIYRLLNLNENQSSQSSGCTEAEERFSWFMLTSACLSKGAQGKATPRRGPEEHDEMSYSNFELGVLFCSRLQEYDTDRLYVYDPQLKGCQCGSKDKNHKARLRNSTPNNPLFLDSVRKVHLPVPFKIRATSYQTDEDYDFFSATPYLHEVTDGTKGNMKLTPYGQRLARENYNKS
eukprot:scaffold331_cov123-Skeletonema_dohrnii-CCMP3373.AAC.4